MNKSLALGIAALAAVLAAATTPSLAGPKNCAALDAVDPDNDGRLDLAEAKKAALKLFHRLNTDKDGTLDRRELRGRVGLFEFVRANKDHDRTLDKAEYLALVEARFMAANRDKDGTIECDELNSLRGRRFLRLLK